jgi:hypothetical protein
MKHSTRVFVAAAAASKFVGHPVEDLYDCTSGLHQHLKRPVDLTRHSVVRDGVAIVYDPAGGERVSLKVEDDTFLGWDHNTGTYFAGAVIESDLMLFDAYDRRYYKFSMH